ncbi:HK97-gp10 family putative phage morphogenesis protein [Bacillus velezensis]|uniref:HK97-gp10 family putative phage morphogenesis protein n=1 Tax=Bacillus amyloliquefaciens group TaxID=1938374 RepID=UPI00141913F9|nr:MULTISPECIES: HK97-gp10 family putative phage morphogenesis protein [Bacillus amyloliquefaciens group]MBI0440911.1 hypothetical protein [Bacillus velezensis]MBM7029456.1 HK97 gp10 family phage protein [Bacillus velezensis]MCY7442881.1 HK97 gp10 family phage protein [Bacillus velezensis]MEC3659235.1 HK97 gp10 family phage protein [Bacillus velezensis]MEC3685473.1 HK97 gp10 family phage protein [Bacillus velezensis]
MRIATNIDGIDELERRLSLMGKDVKKAQIKALRAGGKVLAEGIKQEVPVSDIHHEHIRDDIQVKQTPKRDRIIPDSVSFDVGPSAKTAWRAKFTHEGFTAKNGKFVRGNPFMTRALRVKSEAVQRAIAAEMRKGLGT